MSDLDEQKKAWVQAIKILTRREHSEHEINHKLSSKGYSEEDIEHVLAQLQTQGYQSDARFSEHYIRHRSGRGYGPRRIRMELKEKGVQSAVIESAMDQAEVDWLELARQVLTKKFKGQQAQTWEEKGKQKQFLDYRGFTQDQIESCID